MNRALLQTTPTLRLVRLVPHHRTRRKASTSAGPSRAQSPPSSSSATKRHADTSPSELDIVGTAPYHKSYTLIQYTDSPSTYPSKVNNLTVGGIAFAALAAPRQGLVNHWHDPSSSIGPPLFGKNLPDAKNTARERFPQCVFGVDRMGRNGRLLMLREKIELAIKHDAEWKGKSEAEQKEGFETLVEMAEKRASEDGYPLSLSETYDMPVLDRSLRPMTLIESNEKTRKYHTLLLVCTHGARDCRCGDTGGELVTALQEELAKRKKRWLGLANIWWDGVKIGEIAHVGGHKYAANMLAFPYGDWLGNLRPHHAPKILDRLYEYHFLYRTHMKHASARTPLTSLARSPSEKTSAAGPSSSKPSTSSSDESEDDQSLLEEAELELATHMQPLLPDRSLWRGRMGMTKEDARNLMDSYEEEAALREELRKEAVSSVPLPGVVKRWLLRDD